MESVALATAYTGAKSVDDNAYDRVATVDADASLLNSCWDKVCGRVAEKLQPFLSSSETGEEEFTLNLEVSGAYCDSLTPSVNSDLQACLTSGIIAEWFRFACPTKTPEWETESHCLLNRAFSKLCSRKKPRRSYSE